MNERNIALFQCVNFGDTSHVARRTTEPSAQKALDKLACECRADHLSAKTTDVHIVIFDALMRGENIMNEGGTYAGDVGSSRTRKLFMVSRNDIPRCFLDARVREYLFVCFLVTTPERAFVHVRGRYFPVLVRVIDTREKTLALLALREM